MKERTLNALLAIAALSALATSAAAVSRFFKDEKAATEWVQLSNASHLATSAPHQTGDAGAATVLIEFFDFQCPACRELAAAIDSLAADPSASFRVAHHHFPLGQLHPRAQELALVALCLPSVSQFENFRREAFALQDVIAGNANVTAYSILPEGVDSAVVSSCARKASTLQRLQRELDLADSLGLRGTPSFIVNNRLYTGTRSVAALRAIIRDGGQ